METSPSKQYKSVSLLASFVLLDSYLVSEDEQWRSITNHSEEGEVYILHLAPSEGDSKYN